MYTIVFSLRGISSNSSTTKPRHCRDLVSPLGQTFQCLKRTFCTNVDSVSHSSTAIVSCIPTPTLSKSKYTLSPRHSPSNSSKMAPITSSAYLSSTAFFETAPSPTSLWIGEYVPGKGFWAGAAAPDEVNPSPVRSTHSIVGNAPDTPDTSLHQFLIYMVILAVCFFVCCVYILSKPYTTKWRTKNVVDDEEGCSRWLRSCQYLTFINRSAVRQRQRLGPRRSLSPAFCNRRPLGSMGLLSATTVLRQPSGHALERQRSLRMSGTLVRIIAITGQHSSLHLEKALPPSATLRD
ncbi:hypothetical protein MVEN_01008600 [Mycena venus]|uniref:Uncharacterized protein n=1 Tax=Mycena venus TaxID=2733690 RepID=A0A8H6YE97_9AGAR|nr:hypothetical protein MVEN_01008600 [Mycena venus]